MEPAKQVEEALKKMNISYQLVQHPVAHTTEEADHFIEGIEGVRTKTMFLTNKKKTECYLSKTKQKTCDFNRGMNARI